MKDKQISGVHKYESLSELRRACPDSVFVVKHDGNGFWAEVYPLDDIRIALNRKDGSSHQIANEYAYRQDHEYSWRGIYSDIPADFCGDIIHAKFLYS